MVKLDILSDPVCPWCYIGQWNLDRALGNFTEPPVTLEWHPFQLNPDIPREGMDRQTSLEAKFGGPEKLEEAYAAVCKHAADVGLDFDPMTPERTPNTLDAHRLIHWAGIEGKQTFVVHKLFETYFKEGRDIGDHEVLADVADAAEMDAAVIRRLLESEADIENIRERETHSREMGVTAVPTYIVAQQHAVPGAQPPELWTEVLEEIAGKLDDERGASS